MSMRIVQAVQAKRWFEGASGRRGTILVILLVLGLAAGSAPAGANVITVNTTADADPPNLADGLCSLREAINTANADLIPADCISGSGPDVIEFAGTLGCPATITLTALLPAITATLDVNGYSHPSAAVNTLAVGTDADLCVVLNAGGLAQGLTIAATGSRVRGLVLQNYTTDGIRIIGGSGSTIDGNFIGTNVAGSAASGFTQGVGVNVTGNGHTVGGTTPAARNLISGNGGYGVVYFAADGGFVQGNLVGTNAAGTAAIPNGAGGVGGIILTQGSGGNLVGGATASARNVISGNAGDGVTIFGPDAGGNTVSGNWIGTTAAGTAPLANGRHGIVLYEFAAGASSAGNVIDGNVVAAHPRKAIAIDGPVFTGTVVTDNQIGTLADGVTPAPNGTGGEPPNAAAPDPAIDILHAASAQLAGNRILHQSGGAGVLVRNVEFTVGDPDIGPGSILTASAGNCVVFNADGAVNDTGVGATFTGNWWGAPNGPSGAGGGAGDSVSADIVFNPFLAVAPFFAAPDDGAQIQCPAAVTLLEIPTLGPNGVALLAALLVVAGVWSMRRSRRSAGSTDPAA